jgi:hypothetical protein
MEERTLGTHGKDRSGGVSPDRIEIRGTAALHISPLGAIVADDQTSRSHGNYIGGTKNFSTLSFSSKERSVESVQLRDPQPTHQSHTMARQTGKALTGC